MFRQLWTHGADVWDRRDLDDHRLLPVCLHGTIWCRMLRSVSFTWVTHYNYYQRYYVGWFSHAKYVFASSESKPVDYPDWCEIIRKPDSCTSVAVMRVNHKLPCLWGQGRLRPASGQPWKSDNDPMFWMEWMGMREQSNTETGKLLHMLDVIYQNKFNGKTYHYNGHICISVNNLSWVQCFKCFDVKNNVLLFLTWDVDSRFFFFFLICQNYDTFKAFKIK